VIERLFVLYRLETEVSCLCLFVLYRPKTEVRPVLSEKDARSQAEKIDALAQEYALVSGMKDYDAVNRVYDRFLSLVEPDVIVETLFPLALEILQELSRDMQDTVDKQDSTVCDRIYDRFLAEQETGVVSRFFRTHTPDPTPDPPAQDAD
jgi:hypothetical protein